MDSKVSYVSSVSIIRVRVVIGVRVIFGPSQESGSFMRSSKNPIQIKPVEVAQVGFIKLTTVLICVDL